MASTWNLDLLKDIGTAIAEEAKFKSVQIVLGPTINIHRTPLGGRNFECFSEDALLSGELAAAYTNGLQAEGVGACLKHYVCNDSEFERHSLSVEVDERTLREIYLRPFEIAIKKSQPWTIMAAYNRINGIYACSHDELNNQILKKEWGFDGLVISDWYAAKETVDNFNGGLDLEMPGPAITFGPALQKAIDAGKVDPSIIDDKVIRLLRTINRAGNFDFPEIENERAENLEAHRKVAYQAAAEGMVLLKNDGLLPLKVENIKSLAIIGPNAEDFRIMGGGSSALKPHYISNPVAALRAALPDVKIVEHFGCHTYKYIPGPDSHLISPEKQSTQSGLSCHFLDNFTDTTPINQRLITGNTLYASNPFSPQQAAKALKLQGFYLAESTGDYEFSLLSTGQSRLSINGDVLIDSWEAEHREPGDAFFQQANQEKRASYFIEANTQVEILIEFNHLEQNSFRVVRYGILPPQLEDSVAQAVEIAGNADYVLLITGTNDDWETEGNDRETLALPGRQNELVEKVLAANNNTVLVNNSGSPISMPWKDQAPAIIQSWFAGQEFGNALADIVLGVVNPSGKLPITFPRRLEDTPAYTSYPGEFGKVHYGEGIFVGHRWYLSRDIPSLFPFGHGLSYTQFSYDEMSYKDHVVFVTITNTGKVQGKETIQIYSQALDSKVAQPIRKLIGFTKVDLAAGETATAAIELDDMAFSYWHSQKHGWELSPGEYQISAASSSTDTRLSERILIQSQAN